MDGSSCYPHPLELCLKLPPDVLQQFASRFSVPVPTVDPAVLILLFGASAANVVSELAVRSLSGAGVSRTGELGSFVRFGIIFVAAILAAAVLGIDVAILIVITVIGMGAVALTASLALGLGLRGLSQNVAGTSPKVWRRETLSR